MNDRFLSLLGIARRAGRLSLGSDAVTDSLRKGSARLVFLAEDLSPRTAAGLEAAANEEGIPVKQAGYSMEQIGMALGKKTGIVAVNDAGFAKKLMALQEQTHLGTGGNRI